jgi:gamma-glutamylaminecyclotransferase
MHKVFVFGTLKEGFPNFKTNHGTRVGDEFITNDSFPLYLVGERKSPWLVLEEGKGCPVKGQVFSVSDDVLTEMDNLERINETDGYRRVRVTVSCITSSQEFEVFVYGKPPKMLTNEDIVEELQGEYLLEHAKQYRSRYS